MTEAKDRAVLPASVDPLRELWQKHATDRRVHDSLRHARDVAGDALAQEEVGKGVGEVVAVMLEEVICLVLLVSVVSHINRFGSPPTSRVNIGRTESRYS